MDRAGSIHERAVETASKIYTNTYSHTRTESRPRGTCTEPRPLGLAIAMMSCGPRTHVRGPCSVFFFLSPGSEAVRRRDALPSSPLALPSTAHPSAAASRCSLAPSPSPMPTPMTTQQCVRRQHSKGPFAPPQSQWHGAHAESRRRRLVSPVVCRPARFPSIISCLFASTPLRE